MNRALVAALALVLPSALCAPARGQSSTSGPRRRLDPFVAGNVAAPRGALELTTEAAFTQPLGAMSARSAISDHVGPGVELGLGVGYRAAPAWSVFVGALAHDSDAGSAGGGSAKGVATLVGATWHALPYELVDPAVTIATGYRALWCHDAAGRALAARQGPELARVQMGLELRVSRGFAFTPFAALDTELLAWGPDGSGASGSASGAVSVFISAGLLGRLDVGGARVHRPR
jgi:hypothetical protein